ncbi:MAG: hypothetical protein HYZ25_04825 [Chloroflexi bacterium]|nr:hypothetical protein [Chloroflexota bacterium]
MYLVLFVLHDPDYLEEVLAAWEAEGVGGVTVLFSTGLGRIRQKSGIRDDIPLMPSLDDFYEAPESLSRTLFTTVSDHALVDALVTATRRVVGNLEDPDTGVLMVLPVAEAYGLQKGKPHEQ